MKPLSWIYLIILIIFLFAGIALAEQQAQQPENPVERAYKDTISEWGVKIFDAEATIKLLRSQLKDAREEIARLKATQTKESSQKLQDDLQSEQRRNKQ